MAAKKPDYMVKNGIFWRKFGIQRGMNTHCTSHLHKYEFNCLTASKQISVSHYPVDEIFTTTVKQ